METYSFVHLLIAFILGGLILGGGGGYQPRKPANKPDMKLNDFLAHSKPTKRSGVQKFGGNNNENGQ